MGDKSMCMEDVWVRQVKDFVRKKGGITTTRALGKAEGLDGDGIKHHHGSLTAFLFRHPRVFVLTSDEGADHVRGERSAMNVELVDGSTNSLPDRRGSSPGHKRASFSDKSNILLLHIIEILMDGPLSSRDLGMELQARKGTDPSGNALLEVKQQTGSLANFVHEHSQSLRKTQGEGSSPQSQRRSYSVGLTEQELARTETLRQIMLSLAEGPTPFQKLPYIESPFELLELVKSFSNLFVIIQNTKNADDPIVQLTALAALKTKLWVAGEKTTPFTSSTSDLSENITSLLLTPESSRKKAPRNDSLEVQDVFNKVVEVQNYAQHHSSFHTSFTSTDSGPIVWSDDDIVSAIRKILVDAAAPVPARELGKELQAQGYLQSIKLRHGSLGHFLDDYPQLFSRSEVHRDYEISLCTLGGSSSLVTGLSLDFGSG